MLEHFWSECFRVVSHLPSKSHISEVVQAGSITPLVRLLSSRWSMRKYDTGAKNLSHKILRYSVENPWLRGDRGFEGYTVAQAFDTPRQSVDEMFASMFIKVIAP
jgi:hypothetical protein